MKNAVTFKLVSGLPNVRFGDEGAGGGGAGAGGAGAGGAEEAAALRAQLAQAQKAIDDLKIQHSEALNGVNSKHTEALSTLQKQLDELTTFKVSAEEEKKKALLEQQKSDIDRLSLQHQQELDGFKKQLDKTVADLEAAQKVIAEKDNNYSSQLSALRLTSLKADIKSLAAAQDAFNPDQIVRLILDNFEYDETLGRYRAVTKDDAGKEVKTEVADFVTAFLKDKNNANLVRSKAKPGTGGQGGAGAGGAGGSGEGEGKGEGDGKGEGKGTFNRKMPSFDHIAVTPALVKEAKDANMSVDAYRQILAYREEKLNERNKLLGPKKS